MNKWLMEFSYRINVSGWVFLAAGATAIGFALLTVISHAMRSALANPVKSLRSE
jgi:putative ABC transport system permease protein